MSWLKKLTEGLRKTSSAAKSKLSGIFIGKKIDADTMESLEEALISSDLGVSASQKIVKEFEKNYSGKRILKKPSQLKEGVGLKRLTYIENWSDFKPGWGGGSGATQGKIESPSLL